MKRIHLGKLLLPLVILASLLLASPAFAANNAVVKAYDEVIARYAQAEKDFSNNKNADALRQMDVNFNMAFLNQYDLHYTLVDLANDGTPELIIANGSENRFTATNSGARDTGYVIYDIYGYKNGQAVRLFDAQDFDFTAMGSRARYSIMENGVIQCFGSNSASNTSLSFYKLAANSVNPTLITTTTIENSDTASHLTKDGKDIDSATWVRTNTSFQYKRNLRWYDINNAAGLTDKAKANDIIVYVNGDAVVFDQAPIIRNGRTLVPLRAIFESMGASVGWTSSTQTVTSNLGDVTIRMTIGSNIMDRNGKEIALDVPAQIIGNRTLVPARAIAESFGATVSWDGNTRTVFINK